jgi:hypothetical protein
MELVVMFVHVEQFVMEVVLVVLVELIVEGVWLVPDESVVTVVLSESVVLEFIFEQLNFE